MTEPLDRARAILEHFAREVFPAADLTTINERSYRLSIPVSYHFVVTVRVTMTKHGLWTEVGAPQLHQSMSPDAIARAGGMLIQVSNLIRQIGDDPHVERSSQTAV